MKNLIGDIFKGAETAKKFIETGGDRQKTLTERHQADMGSDNLLSKSIRPVTLIVLLLIQVLIVVLSAIGQGTPDPVIISQHGVLLLGAFSFYFHSKKVERVAEKNAKANIALEEMKMKHEQKIDRKRLRMEKRAQRRQERRQEKEG